MHKKEYKLKWSASNKECRVAMWQKYHSSRCFICDRRLSGGFKEYKRYTTCNGPFRMKLLRSWKYYRKFQDRER